MRLCGGTRSSNRKVPVSVQAGFDGDEPAREMIEAQDHAVAAASGRPRSYVRTVVRSPVKVATDNARSDRKVRGAIGAVTAVSGQRFGHGRKQSAEMRTTVAFKETGPRAAL